MADLINHNLRDFLFPYPVPSTGSSEPKKILIKPLDKGYLVKVGCKTIAVSSADILVKHLTEYLKDPAATEKKFNDNKLKF